jgi:hypothetical protein
MVSVGQTQRPSLSSPVLQPSPFIEPPFLRHGAVGDQEIPDGFNR